MIHAGIVGGAGYAGAELLRLLASHPHAQLRAITSRSAAGTRVADLFPSLRGHVTARFEPPDAGSLSACDVVMFATPNGTAMTMVPELLAAGVRVIDLAADFRLKDPVEWEHWYGKAHACPELLQEAVYGLPEMNRSAVREARLVANPGCYPTAVQLGFLPLLEVGLLDRDRLIADCKSGVSGAGRQAELATSMGEAGESLKAYAVAGHRHLPEICQELRSIAGGTVHLTFVPHLAPMIRGIHATLYAPLLKADVDLQRLFEERYAGEPCVDVLPAAAHPDTSSVRGANVCRVAVHRPQGGDVVVVLSVVDNLVKGAAGQAIQNMNLMFDIEETAGLGSVALFP
jgi:N-acetyl-gamma-glutamyl-phosphate reductase